MAAYKYLAIVEWAKKYIEETGLRAGDKFLSEAALCELHSTSRQTVRQALEVLKRKNIIVKRRGSGTFVQGTKQGGAKVMPTIGVILTFFNNYIFPEILAGIDGVLSKNGYAMQLFSTNNSVSGEERALEAVLAQNLDGVIVEPCKSGLPNSNVYLYNKIRDFGIPIVFINTYLPSVNIPVVAMDNVGIGYLATEHLITLGHRKIAIFMDFEDYQGHQRYKGYTDCLLSHRIAFDEKRVLWFAFKEWDHYFTTMRSRILDWLAASTAVICYNDMLASWLIDFCRQEGIRVPEGMSVVGIDDSDLAARCVVPITSVRHAKQNLGEAAAQLVLDMIKSGSTEGEGRLFKSKLVARQSAAAPESV
jgi:GntR family transcriptional regulator of arabinose operon